jgi:hypothetical protein
LSKCEKCKAQRRENELEKEQFNALSSDEQKETLEFFISELEAKAKKMLLEVKRNE